MHSKIIGLLCCILGTGSSLYAQHAQSRSDILYTNLAGAAFIAGWGFANWEYGKSAPHTSNEGWFGNQTKYGGADKLGHFYGSYLIGSSLGRLYESWDYTQNEAALYGSLSSFFLMNVMEVGDAFSAQQGFSYEDFTVNTLGALCSYVFYTHPELSKRVDIRIEYLPSFKTADVITEYEQMKYVIALKGDGFDFISNPVLRYGELHLGYYTRNFIGASVQERERILYVGIGLNLSKTARQNGYNTTADVLNYYQLPYTYVSFDNNLNR